MIFTTRCFLIVSASIAFVSVAKAQFLPREMTGSQAAIAFLQDMQRYEEAQKLARYRASFKTGDHIVNEAGAVGLIASISNAGMARVFWIRMLGGYTLGSPEIDARFLRYMNMSTEFNSGVDLMTLRKLPAPTCSSIFGA